MIVRDATPEEMPEYLAPDPDGDMDAYEKWVGLLTDGEGMYGNINLYWRKSHILAVGWNHNSEDESGALLLYRAAVAKAKSLGFDKVGLHIPHDYPHRYLEFWLGRGAYPLYAYLELPL